MKKRMIIAWMCVLMIVMCACGLKHTEKKKNNINGTYYASKCSVNGFVMPPSEIAMDGSNVNIMPYGENTMASMYLYLDDSLDYLTGYIVKESVYGGEEQYCFHVTSHTSEFIDENLETCNLYYRPETDTVELCFSGNIVLWFTKP